VAEEYLRFDEKKLIAYFQKDGYSKLSGIKLTDIGKGWAKTRMEIKQDHLNSVDTVQGGAIFTLADYAFAAASNSYGTIAMGIDVHISFFKAVREGMLYAEAKELSMHPKLATYEVDVTDDTGDRVARFHGTVYRKEKPLNF
jgi:acyl-CoA thioesterase